MSGSPAWTTEELRTWIRAVGGAAFVQAVLQFPGFNRATDTLVLPDTLHSEFTPAFHREQHPVRILFGRGVNPTIVAASAHVDENTLMRAVREASDVDLHASRDRAREGTFYNHDFVRYASGRAGSSANRAYEGVQTREWARSASQFNEEFRAHREREFTRRTGMHGRTGSFFDYGAGPPAPPPPKPRRDLSREGDFIDVEARVVSEEKVFPANDEFEVAAGVELDRLALYAQAGLRREAETDADFRARVLARLRFLNPTPAC